MRSRLQSLIWTLLLVATLLGFAPARSSADSHSFRRETSAHVLAGDPAVPDDVAHASLNGSRALYLPQSEPHRLLVGRCFSQRLSYRFSDGKYPALFGGARGNIAELRLSPRFGHWLDSSRWILEAALRSSSPRAPPFA